MHFARHSASCRYAAAIASSMPLLRTNSDWLQSAIASANTSRLGPAASARELSWDGWICATVIGRL